ncbi:GNAT family N-acetyltransferase [Peribacillus sp. SCS-37]|uniref:GNAT family N-acetyltransferase n=1 Tax=Paraperibacillus esterisolvens TaxID=3115296 RepID=UPI003906700B
MKIVQATIEDLIPVSRLFDLYRVFYQQPEDQEGALAFLKERFINQDSVIFTAVSEEGNYVGFTQLYPLFSSVSMKKSYLLNDLFVHPDARSRGVGGLLLDAAREYAIKTGAKGLSLQTALDNTAAQALYEKYGYNRETEFIQYNLLTPGN